LSSQRKLAIKFTANSSKGLKWEEQHGMPIPPSRYFFGNALHLLASSERLPHSNFGNTVGHILTAKLLIPDPFSGTWNQG